MDTQERAMVPKETVASFVKDAKEMEVSVYTLRELSKECRKRAGEIVVQPRAEVQRLNANIARMKSEIAYLQARKDSVKKIIPKEKKITAGDIIGGAYFFGAALMCLICGIMFSIRFGKHDVIEDSGEVIEHLMILLIGFIIATPIALILSYILNKKAQKKELQKEKDKKTGAINTLLLDIGMRENALCEYTSQITVAQERLRHTEKVASGLIAAARDFEEKARQIHGILQECYTSTGIVPQDYRSIDCVIVFDHVFRNDLADTMRQAVFYYEEKKYRTMVLRGIDSIYQMLGKMAEVMMDVRTVLNDISGNVTRMCYDLGEQIDNQSRMAYAQEELARETKATRYAIERHNAAQQAHNDYVRNQIHWST